ncbi:uncharacterized protein SPPG_06382 [Spizellomyces punctatus DAOM BR117]|uniref:BHLH domain-containing protein n=1 Tax=Spizellomyces punctatus (strain DAOM BR117) TaxID=645134 RepID=A0A0L0HCS1_SPIPD|nr:uncharacterized protein SPPG_06382 [Spizellomyces punctatus DAOM BR117]KNC98704.1 hypothetical protein SPPG_06382 [Spizellomyces punctatus DAOM BR117]|eukprot:XP_016606744.1 hypothetical protein SPPG_06382 [Spizellomyces punctatus DAOM BR117]
MSAASVVSQKTEGQVAGSSVPSALPSTPLNVSSPTNPPVAAAAVPQLQANDAHHQHHQHHQHHHQQQQQQQQQHAHAHQTHNAVSTPPNQLQAQQNQIPVGVGQHPGTPVAIQPHPGAMPTTPQGYSPGPGGLPASFPPPPPGMNQQAYASVYAAAQAAQAAAQAAAAQAISSPGTPSNSKAPVGSEEWLRQRRENHKEVERRRRETINDGINELAKLIPEGEKNKGRILSRAVQYIHQLKEQESTNLEKWTLEKLLCEQAIQELSAQVESLKAENEQLRSQLAMQAAEGPARKKPRKDDEEGQNAASAE